MKDVMLNLETYGIRPGCAVRSIGAVLFDPLTGDIGAEFYENIDMASCAAKGLSIDPATVEWWNQQDEAAQAALLVNPVPIGTASLLFYKWYKDVNAERVWSHGASFDPPIWEAAIRMTVQYEAPWKYDKIMDTHTVRWMAETVYDKLNLLVPGISTFQETVPERVGTHHNALDDCKHQIKVLHAVMKYLGWNR